MSLSSQFSHTVLRGFLTFLAAFAVIGCSVGDFIGAYFNTYYNARRLFDEAEEEIWNQPDTRQSGQNYLLVFTTSPNAKTKLISVIEKCSKLLQYHPESNLVDESLLMIGKSFFYQAEYQKAERKFKELIDGTGGELVPEARMLLAYSYYKVGNRDSARAEAMAVAAAPEEADDEVLSRVALLLGRIEQDNGNYDQARMLYQSAAETAPNSELASTAWLRTADMLALLADYGDAELTYHRASSVGSNYVAEYRGAIGAARMRSRQGNYDEALDALAGLRENNNFREFFGEIDLETAAVLDTMGNFQEALGQYAYVDTSYARTEVSARSYYRRGLLFEKRLGLYDSARVAYNKGRGEFPQADVTPELGRRAEALNRYHQLTTDIIRHDSIRAALIAGPPPVVPAADTVRVDSVRADSAAVGTRQAPVSATPPMSLDTVMHRLARDMTELGGLFFTGLQRPDSAKYWFSRVLDEHPQSPFAARALYTLAQLTEQDSAAPRGRADSLYDEIIRRFPSSEFAVEARRIVGLPPVAVNRDEAESLYTAAERYLEVERNEEALADLRRIVSDFPGSASAPRAQYAIGWIYEHVIDEPDSAVANYRRLMDAYPASPFASKVQPRIPAPATAPQPAPAPPENAAGQLHDDDRRPPGMRETGAMPRRPPGAGTRPDTLDARRD